MHNVKAAVLIMLWAEVLWIIDHVHPAELVLRMYLKISLKIHHYIWLDYTW